MYLSKSKYCKGVQCKKILWLEKNKPEVKEEIDNSSVFDNGTNVGILAQDLFGKHTVVEFNEDLSKMIDDTNKKAIIGSLEKANDAINGLSGTIIIND